MINLHESMGPGRDQTRNPWICSQTRICSQTHYRLSYAARQILLVSYYTLSWKNAKVKKGASSFLWNPTKLIRLSILQYKSVYQMGLSARKPVFGVSGQIRAKPVCSVSYRD